MNMIFKKGIYLAILGKPYLNHYKSECGNYQGINLVFVGSKLLSNMILVRMRDAVDKFI